ncbi:MAG: prolipoprotein diacylglyceryl transferase [Clostridiaceae bacterium]
MNPVAFYVFGIGIRWYGILITMGIILGILISKKSSEYKDVNYEELLNIVLISLPIGIIGARIYYVAFNFSIYENNLIDIINIRHGGLAIHGGIIFGLIAAYIYCRVRNLKTLDYLDVAAPSIVLGQSIGRWGNFFNSEAHGGVVSYDFIKVFPEFIQNGMKISDVYYHPTFLYESVWDFVVFIIIFLLLKRNRNNQSSKGLIILTYVGLYSIGRFFIEGLRTDSLYFGNFRIAQIQSIVGIGIWIIYLFINHKKKEVRYY